MPIIAAALQLAINVFCCYHVWKSGRPYYWMFIIIGFPVFGALAYLAFEVVPSSGARTHVKRVIKHFKPGADFKARLDEVERCGSMANKMALADECINTGQFDEAIKLYKSVMVGQYTEDLTALYGLGSAYFYKRDAQQAVATLTQVIEREPMFDRGDAKLMLAQALEGADKHSESRDCFEALLLHYPGEEARAQYVAFLCRQKDRVRAQSVITEIDKRFRLGGAAYRKENSNWRTSAQQAFSTQFKDA
jgi:hypothetical protein